MTRCVGHRGAAGLAPENTLAAFQAGIDAGSDLLECDVHMTTDGQLAVIHDPDLQRTTDGKGLVGDLTMAEVRAFNAAACFQDGRFERQTVPTLPELLAFVADRRPLQVEIKVRKQGPYPGIEDTVLDALRRFGALDAAQVISFDAGTVRRLRERAPAATLGYLASERSVPDRLRDDANALAAHAKDSGANFLSLDYRFFRPDHLTAARAAGLDLAVWTVNELADMRRFATMGLAAITSDRPDILRGVLDGAC